MKGVFQRIDLKPLLAREPLVLAALIGITVFSFLMVSALSQFYDARRVSLAKQLAADAAAHVRKHQYAAAVEDYRTALEYARANDNYELHLAEALIGLKRYDEAQFYLSSLRDRTPDSGAASLDLARVAVKQGRMQQALRFYHSAVYGSWPGDEEAAQRRARIELIDYLTGIGASSQADAELIELQASLGPDRADQDMLGGMFAKVGDQQRALAVYQEALRVDRRDAAALAGAGAASYALGQYEAAQRYYQQALAARPGDAAAAAALKETQMVIEWDPFRSKIRERDRNRIVLAAFRTAGARLKMCATPNAAQQSLQQSWTALKPQMTSRELSGNAQLVNTAMNLVFSVERETGVLCGPPTEADQSLRMIADLHEED